MSRRVSIDLVTYDERNDEFVLYLVEDGPWPAVDTEWAPRLLEIQDRVLSAADAAIDGHLAQRFPITSRAAVRIQVDSPSGCPKELEDLILAIGRFLDEDPSYAAGIRASLHIRAMRVVTGKQMGRFASTQVEPTARADDSDDLG